MYILAVNRSGPKLWAYKVEHTQVDPVYIKYSNGLSKDLLWPSEPWIVKFLSGAMYLICYLYSMLQASG